MRYLVTGGAGFIGSNLVDKLIADGHEVVVIDNESANVNEEFFWNEKAENHKLDINNFEEIKPLFRNIDIVFHLAAESRIQPSLANPLLAIRTNVVGTANVLQASREAGVSRVVYSSTSSAYGLKNKPPLDEGMVKDCLNPYSVSKTAGEEICQMYTNLFGLETVIFRYFNVYGKRHPLKGPYAPVVGIFLRQLDASERLTIVGDGEQRRDFTHVDDIVRANLDASKLVNTKCVGKIINVGTGHNHSVNELASFISNKTIYLPIRRGEARETLASTKIFHEIFGWVPKNRLEEWVKNEIDNKGEKQ
jgi:UDP-glucose 4-epimerase